MFNIGGLELLLILIVVASLGAFIWALVDAIRRPQSQYPGGRGRTAWIAGLIVGWFFALWWLVAIAYLLGVRRPMGPIRLAPQGETPGSPPPPPA